MKHLKTTLVAAFLIVLSVSTQPVFSAAEAGGSYAINIGHALIPNKFIEKAWFHSV